MVKITEEKIIKKIFEEKITCPHCDKRIIVKKTKKIIEAAIPAEYEEKTIVEKDSQTKLTDAEKKAGVKKK